MDHNLITNQLDRTSASVPTPKTSCGNFWNPTAATRCACCWSCPAENAWNEPFRPRIRVTKSLLNATGVWFVLFLKGFKPIDCFCIFYVWNLSLWIECDGDFALLNWMLESDLMGTGQFGKRWVQGWQIEDQSGIIVLVIYIYTSAIQQQFVNRSYHLPDYSVAFLLCHGRSIARRKLCHGFSSGQGVAWRILHSTCLLRCWAGYWVTKELSFIHVEAS